MDTTLPHKPLNVHTLLQTIVATPGLTTAEIAEQLQTRPQKVNARLFSMKNRLHPEIKTVNSNGLNRWYPFNAVVTIDPLHERSSVPIVIGGKGTRVAKMTAAELKEFEGAKPVGKYSELLTLMDQLKVGEGIVVPVAEVGQGLRGATRSFFQQRKKFSIRTMATHCIVELIYTDELKINVGAE